MPKALIAIAGLVIAALAGIIYINANDIDWRSALRPTAPNKPVIIQEDGKSSKNTEPSSEQKSAEEAAKKKLAEAEKQAKEKAAAAKLEAERLEAEKLKAEKIEAEKREAEKLAAEAAQKAEMEKAAAEKLAAEKLAAEKLAAEKKAAALAKEERQAAEKATAEKKAAEKAKAEALAAEQAAAEKAAADKLAAEKAAATNSITPAFDIVRVEEDGNTLAAGRAEPGATVTLNINGKPAGQTTATERGEWVLVLEQPIETGSHQLTLQSEKTGGAPKVSKQAALVNMPESGVEKPLIVLSDDTSGSRVLQAPTEKKPDEKQMASESAPAATDEVAEKPAPQQSASAEPKKKLPLTLGAVDYDDTGAIVFSGRATAGEPVRLYVDNTPLADAISDHNGNWVVSATKQIDPGQHALRVDQITKAGKVVSRVQLPFFREKPAKVATLLQSRQPKPTNAPAGEPAKTKEPKEETVQPAPNEETDQTAATIEEKSAAAAAADAASPTLDTAPAPDTPNETVDVAASTPTAQQEETDKPTQETSEQSQTSSELQTSDPAKIQEDQSAATPAKEAQTPDQHTDTSPPATDTSAENVATPKAPAQPVVEAAPEPAPVETASAETGTQEDTTPAPNAEAAVAAASNTVDSAAGTSTPAAPSPGATNDPVAPKEETAAPPEALPDVKPGHVVIQPGNNLWRISRVVYGRGVRYSVIYQANKDQIRDPALIFPGQIFSTPGATPPPSIDPKLREPLNDAKDPLAETGAGADTGSRN